MRSPHRGWLRWYVLAAVVVLTRLASCAEADAQVPVEQPAGPVVVLAHRGASAYAPEHTLAAYDLAVEHDTDFLECDLQLSRDEVLVCVHDTTVDRTTGGQHTGRVDAYTLAELRTMDFGSWFDPSFAGARIVTFAEQLDCYLARNPRLRFHVETKSPAEYGGRMEPLLVAALAERGLIPDGPADPQTSTVIVQSFELASLEAVKALAPSLPTAWLWAVPPPEAADGQLPPTVDVAAPVAQAILADPTFPARAHGFGHEVHTWTVDDRDTMDQLLDLGVDGIFTNRPDVLRAAVDERGTGVPAATRANPAPGSFAPGCPAAATAAGPAATPAGAPATAPVLATAALARTGPADRFAAAAGAAAVIVALLGLALGRSARPPR